MKIGVDVRCFAQGKNTGVEEYAQKTLRAIFEADEKNEYILFFNAWRGRQVDFSWATKYKNVSLKKYVIPNKLLNFSLWFLHYPKLDKLCGNVDVFFMPNNNFCALSDSVKLFLTVHDLSFEHHTHSFSLKRRLWHFFVNPRLLAKRANKIFAVSAATRADICETYDIDKNKVSITRNGLTSVEGKYNRNSMELIMIKEKYNLPYQFILYFGTIEPRKNIVSIIKAYEQLRATNKNTKHQLIIAGARGWKGEEIYGAAVNAKYKEDIVILADIPEDEKELLYTLASVFVYPSFFEGFGFPPLEAINCLVPTIVSHTTSLPEVAGDNAIMVNPTRPDEIVIALNEIITNKKLQKILTSNSKQHTEKFQWNDISNIFAQLS